jgi:hypothetical protein
LLKARSVIPKLAIKSTRKTREGGRMPNVLDVEALRRAARRAARKVGDDKTAARFETLGFERLLSDPRNFRPATEDEIAAAPAWAQTAAQRGEQLCVVTLHRGAVQRLNNVARKLAMVCALAATERAPRPSDSRYIGAAREFLNKIDRANFDVVARKALAFSRVYAGWSEVADMVCPAGEVAATQGKTWTRITSLAELRAVGREMTNCLARTSETAAYGGHLKDGRSQFWVLRDARGVALVVAMAPTAAASDFREVKGPRNTPVSRTNPDLLCLSNAILIKGDEPPPPPSPAPPSALEHVLFFGLPGSGAPSLPRALFALDSQEEIARLSFAATDVIITRRRRRAS